jgi:CTP:molybdopterin cytidylyltransferase MocA
MSRPEHRNSVALLVLAAGASSRMGGRDKLLEQVDGHPLLRHVCEIASATGYPTTVTLPPEAAQREHTLTGLDVKTITVADARTGMAASLRAYAQCHPSKTDGVMVILADMPDITTSDLQNLIDNFLAEHGEKVIRASDASGLPGHPVVFPERLVAGFADLIGDQGARNILKDEEITYVTLPDRHATTDLDTPADWTKWRDRHGVN